jgi:pimeloyl-ACP methyl ester carboxylesterase
MSTVHTGAVARPRRGRRQTVLAALVVLVAAGLGVGAMPAAADSGPPLTIPEAKLAAAVSCDAGAYAGKPTVLLIHGTGGTPQEVWGWNYAIALPAAGFGVCMVTLPGRALVNFTDSAQYAVYAARHAHQVSGHKIALLGHSQGSLVAVWITKFWPDVARDVTDVVTLASPMHGTQLANTLCVVGSCSLIAWQMAMGSHVTNAASNAPLPAGPSFTSIGSRDDEAIFPQPYTSQLLGATVIMVQDVCPGRPVDHGALLSDAVAYQLVLDALTHDGPADVRRVSPSTCLQTTMPGVDPVTAIGFANTLVSLSVGLFNATGWISAEPPLPDYAAPYGG